MPDKRLFDSTQGTVSLLTKTYRLLTKAQNASAVAFSTFAVIHGAQVLVANVGGTRSANRWIILGRPFYQDEHLEGLLVTGSAVVHVVTSLSKLTIRYYWRRRKLSAPSAEAASTDKATEKNSSSAQLSTNTLPYHRWTGYVLIPLVGIHYYLVRSIPLQYYGDSSFIDFGYIAWGLQNKPIFTYTLHTTLGIAASYHFVSGLSYLFRRRKSKSNQQSPEKLYKSGSSTLASGVPLSNSSSTKNWIQKGLATTLSIGFIASIMIIGRETKKIPLRLDFEQMYKRMI
ncbi:hypothetical protein BDF20DRAFT_998444 [Mycotypha africana]|uniref:uncharacterized protein n=1 Tax=Mycotypha africana TaxID=64632 RepID=UPI0023014185|nr:uncharacterized protein BDF20DRAFT_998444 [Mycotypha africana]KAI8987902.1 hypothetical protein BDF20DRAFT_998444 [Mycotypha africana]